MSFLYQKEVRGKARQRKGEVQKDFLEHEIKTAD